MELFLFLETFIFNKKFTILMCVKMLKPLLYSGKSEGDQVLQLNVFSCSTKGLRAWTLGHPDLHSKLGKVTQDQSAVFSYS